MAIEPSTKGECAKGWYPEAMLHLFFSPSSVCCWHCFVSTSGERELGVGSDQPALFLFMEGRGTSL